MRRDESKSRSKETGFWRDRVNSSVIARGEKKKFQ